MEVIQKGEGEPEHGILACIHGDEPAGKKAIDRFLDSGYELQKPVKFVIANEEAMEEGERFLEADLNRSFPGDPESDKHEERLAASIADEIEGLKLMDIHSTRSQPVPFIVFGDPEGKVLDRMRGSGVSKACSFEETSGSTSFFDCFGVEVGPQGTVKAAEKAYDILINYLASEGIIDEDYERSDPDVFRYYETVSGGDWEFLKTNFEIVREGEVFATSGTTDLVSSEDFYPILMSTDGYDEILGHKARKLGTAKKLIEE